MKNYAELINASLQKLEQALSEFADTHYTPDGYFKPYLPQVRLPKPIHIDFIEIGLIYTEKAYLHQNREWYKHIPQWYIHLNLDNLDEPIEFYQGDAMVGQRLIPYLSPRQIYKVITAIRTFQKWVYDRIAGLQRAEEEIKKQQASAIEVLDTELALLALEGGSQ